MSRACWRTWTNRTASILQFNQTVTATGRLSSSNPNLQNIPVGEIAGLNLRRAFVAAADRLLLSADYSQIELRVMAHFSGDENLLKAFAEGTDIHQRTADLVFGADLFAQRQELRRRAKIINFSIIYGSGAYSLAKELGVSFAEAKDFIERYFEKYSGVKRFMDKVIAAAEKDPEVRTMSGRVRPIPEMQSSNRTVKENGNRMAINTIIQGSAADIIKIAMIRIHEHLRPMQSRLLLQVHDELVFEYPARRGKAAGRPGQGGDGERRGPEGAAAGEPEKGDELGRHDRNAVTVMKEIDAAKFKEIIKRGMEHLFRDRDLLNRINVFPVADGDTGDNLVHTLKPVYEQIDAIYEARLDNLTARLAAADADVGQGQFRGDLLAVFFQLRQGAEGQGGHRPGRLQPGHGKGRPRDL